MKRFHALMAAVLLLAVSVSAAELPYLDKLPPLIERDKFFGDPEISGAQLSPDGEFLSFRKPYNDVINIWVKKRGEPFENAYPITADTDRPVRGYFWSNDSRYILYIQDKGGNENFHIYAVDPLAEPYGDQDVPEARDLTPMDSIRAAIYSLPEETPNTIYVGLNDRDQRYHDLYSLNIDTGERTLIRQNDEKVASWVFDQDGNLRLATRETNDGGTEIFRLDGEKMVSIYTCSNEESANPIGFHENGEWFYMVTNKGENVDLSRLILFNPETREEKFVESDPEGEVDFGGAIFSERTDEIIATYYVGDRLRIYFKDYKFRRAYKRLKHQVPDGDLYLGSITSDDRYWLVAVTSDTDPGARYLYDMKRNNVRLLYRGRPELPREYLAEMKPITYQARDGLTIHAYLTLPRNVENEEVALVVNPHGGPWARDRWGYNPYAQFLANRGYAVLQINFRGSTGYGKDFLNAGKKEWGDAMQDDITDGVNYLIEKGIVDPDRVSIFGGSYGGYATLAGLAFTPDLFAAGVDYVGVSNLITLLKSIPPYWETARNFFNEHVGDPDDPEDAKRMKRQSPLFSAEKIKAPLLVVQGANDPRVKKAESDQIVVAMRDLGREVEYIVAPDEGHGFAGEENRMAFTVAMERFLAEHLGGRYQESVKPEVKERLEEITVPVESVEMPKAPEGLEDAEKAGFPDFNPEAMREKELTFTLTVNAAGQEIEMSGTEKIEKSEFEGTPAWRILSSQKSAMMNVASELYVHRETLKPIHAAISQGPVQVELDYTEKAITGKINMRGNEIPIQKELDGPVLGSSQMEATIQTLPLREGFKTNFRTFDIRSQSTQLYSLEVTGTEKVSVPAGDFEAWRVETRSLDQSGGDGVYYVSREKKHLVKAELQLPAASGGGTAVMEVESIK